MNYKFNFRAKFANIKFNLYFTLKFVALKYKQVFRVKYTLHPPKHVMVNFGDLCFWTSSCSSGFTLYPQQEYPASYHSNLCQWTYYYLIFETDLHCLYFTLIVAAVKYKQPFVMYWLVLKSNHFTPISTTTYLDQPTMTTRYI